MNAVRSILFGLLATSSLAAVAGTGTGQINAISLLNTGATNIELSTSISGPSCGADPTLAQIDSTLSDTIKNNMLAVALAAKTSNQVVTITVDSSSCTGATGAIFKLIGIRIQ